MVNLTIKDLFHEPVRVALIIIGLTVSLLMVHIGIGMITGVLDESKRIIKEGDYDAYLIQRNRNIIMDGGRVSDDIYNKTSQINGVEGVDKMINEWIELKFGKEKASVGIIGYDVKSDYLKPWDCIDCSEKDIKSDNKIIIDKLVNKQFSNIKTGDKVKGGDLDNNLKIVGFCQNNQRTGNAVMWCNLETAKALLHFGNESTYLAVKLKSGYSIRDLENDLSAYEEEISIVSSSEMEARIDDFLLNDFGLASSIGILAVLGFLVAMIVISTTLYQSVVDKLSELVSLKALGAKKSYINNILINQTFILVSISFFVSLILALFIAPFLSMFSALPVNVNPYWAAFTYLISLILGILCTLFSIRKVHKTDPAIIFRG